MRINDLENNHGQKLAGKLDILVIARCQVKLLLFTQDNGIFFLHFTSSLKKCGKYTLLSSQSNYSYFYVLMIIKNRAICLRHKT